MKRTLATLIFTGILAGAAWPADAEVRRAVLVPAAHGFVQINWGVWGMSDTFEVHSTTNMHAQTFMGSHGTGGEYKGYAVYDTAEIPDNAHVLQVNLFYDSGSIGITTFQALSGNPESQSDASNAWFFVSGQTNVYDSIGDFEDIEGTNRRRSMSGPFLADLQMSLPSNSFALSVNGGPTVFASLKLEVFYSPTAVTSSYSTLSVAGPFGAWNPRSHPLALIEPYTWRGSYPIADPTNLTFKFLANADWNVANWGDSNAVVSFPHDGTAATSGADIVYAQPFTGRATFTFNEQTRAYRVAAYQTDYSSLSVAGTFNGWNAGANELELISNHVWQGTVFLLTYNVQFKFVANDDLGAANWGDAAVISSFPYVGTGTMFGADIQLGACFSAGNYRFTFDESTARYMVEKLPASTYGGLSVAGTFNGWDTLANPLAEIAPGVWEGSAALPAGDTAFKFVAGGSWEVGDFGETNQTGFALPLNGAPEFRGGDVVVSNAVAGSHAFRLDLANCAYRVATNSSGASESTNAYDAASDAAYAGGWPSGANGGFGFTPWSYFADPNSGVFIGSSASNGGGDPGGDGDIDVAGKAWGLFSSGPILNVGRDFNNQLAIGHTLHLDLDNGYVDSGGFVGFNLLGPNGGHGRPTLFTFQFQGGATHYQMTAGSTQMNTGIAFTDSGLHFDIAVVDAGGGVGALNVHVAGKAAGDGAAFDNHFNGLPISGGDGTIRGLQLFNQAAGSGADHNLFFNNLKITAPPVSPTLPVDGLADAEYGSALAQQSVQTSFGNSTAGQTGFANGSELDLGYGTVVGDQLYLLLAGNLEANFNKLEIFLDTRAGGQNRLRGDNPAVDGNGLNRMGDEGANTNGLRFDAGFEADYWIGATVGDAAANYSFFVNYAELLTSAGNTNGYYLGSTAAASDGTLAYGTNPFGIKGTIDNSNTNGVTGGTNTSSWGLLYVGSSGAGVLTGVELAIPLAAIGNPTGLVKVCAFINSTNHAYLSNQALEGLLVSGYPTHPPANLPSLGEPRGVDFNNYSSRQWFEVRTDCQPGSFQWSQPSYEVRENGDTNLSFYLTLWVTRTNGDCQSVELHYATADGTATAGADYFTASSTVSFAQGQLSNSVPFVCLSEGVPEPTELVWITLSDPSAGAALGPQATALISIRDPDEDGDGISDNYERHFFASLTNCTATGDWDQDGQSDRKEACAGTDPDDDRSLFHTEIPFQSDIGGTNLVSWASATGRFYRVERATNLLGSFNSVTSALAATPPLNVFTDAVSSAESLYYRIQIESGCP